MVSVIKKIFNWSASYFREIYIYESNYNKKKIKFKNLKIKLINKKEIEQKEIIIYLKKENKFKRFSKQCFLVVLKFKKKIIGYGWLYIGKNWFITEINRKINIKNKVLLFDFFIKEKFRNKNFYRKFLILIKNIKLKKVFLIYSLKSNFYSCKGIINSGFKLRNKIKKRINW